MDLQRIKDDLIGRVTVDTQETFRLLDRYLRKDSNYYVMLKVLQGNYSDFRTQSVLLNWAYDQISRENAKTWNALFNLINELTEEDIRSDKTFKYLVICYCEEDKAYMTKYFDGLPRKFDYSVQIFKTYQDVDNYDLIVFDNHSVGALRSQEDIEKLSEEKKTHVSLLVEYLQKAPKWLVHFGDYNFLLNDYRETYNAANNKFSLYHCLKEMREFIEEFRVGQSN